MYASMGGALAAGGVLLTVVFALLFRHPKAPGWTQGELAAELVAVVLTGIVGLGLGYLAVAFLSFDSTAIRWLDLAGLGAAVSILIVGWWLLDPKARLQAYERAAGSARVIDLDPTPPTPAPRPASRKAA